MTVPGELPDRLDVEVDGRVVRVTTLGRVLFPESGFTKGRLLDYYLRVAPVLLPHLAGHPVTLRRFPEGVGGRHFFQTRCPPHPPWVRTVTFDMARTGKRFEVAVLDDTASLVWAAQLSTIELHPYLARADRLDEPTALVLDLDPGPPAGLADACRVALRARELLDATGLPAYAKTSGAKGLHVHVPVAPGTTYADTKRLARELARVLVREDPDRVVDRMARELRPGRVFVDWSQNDPGKSTVAPYSLRALRVPSVAMPVTWDEVAAGVRSPATLFFDVPGALERVRDQAADPLPAG